MDHDDALLSRLLFDARERIEMQIDSVERRSGRPDLHGRTLVAEIDSYRIGHGWNPDGFGGEGRR